MAVRPLSDMTWEDVQDLDKARALAVLPIGAIEAHGPHLPLSTDNHIAEAMAREGADRLAAVGHRVILLPTVGYTPAPFAQAFPGTISVGPGTLTALVTDIGTSLLRHGIRTLAVANAHLDPVHLGAIAQASGNLSQAGMKCVFPDLTRRPWAMRLGEEFRSGACHAGRYESSVMLAERPGLVLDGVRRRLPPNPASLSDAIREGKRTFEEAGGPMAYFGWPAEASPTEGRELVSVLGAILEEAVVGELDRVRAE